jgi:hypothetical protein
MNNPSPSPVAKIAVVAGVFIAFLMLFGVFNAFSNNGLPTVLMAFIICLVGLFSMRGDQGNFGAGLFLVFVGLLLFAQSAELFGTGNISWLWPVAILLGAILFIVYLAKPQTNA